MSNEEVCDSPAVEAGINNDEVFREPEEAEDTRKLIVVREREDTFEV